MRHHGIILIKMSVLDIIMMQKDYMYMIKLIFMDVQKRILLKICSIIFKKI
jgi:hypothetical protein